MGLCIVFGYVWQVAWVSVQYLGMSGRWHGSLYSMWVSAWVSVQYVGVWQVAQVSVQYVGVCMGLCTVCGCLVGGTGLCTACGCLAGGTGLCTVCGCLAGDVVYMNSSSGHTLTQAQWNEKELEQATSSCLGKHAHCNG